MAKTTDYSAGDRVKFVIQYHSDSVNGTASTMGVGPGTEGTVTESSDDSVMIKIKGWKNTLSVKNPDAVTKI